MKRIALILMLGFLPVASARAVQPDYSQDALLKWFHETVKAPSRHVENHIGDVVVTNGKTRIRVAYLPLLPPLSGSAIGVTQKLPNPFELTNTPIAMSRQQWERR